MSHLYIYMIWTRHEITPRLIYVSFIHVYALTHLCLIYTHSLISTYLCASVRGTWRMYMCCITHPSKCVTWLIHVCSVTHPCVWHNASTRVTWLTQVCDVAHACVSHTWIRQRVWHVQTATHSYVGHSSFIVAFNQYGVASISRLLKIIGLFCKRAL